MRPLGGGGGQDRGNRIDNRARGNANQLHEKYKTLARDAQMHGDRVMTEYYLQFADHYFRVLAESRGRFEEQRPQRRDFNDDFDGDDSDGGDDLSADSGQQGEREPRRDRNDDYRRDDRGAEGRNQSGRDQDDRGRDGHRANGYASGQDGRDRDGRDRDRAPRYERRDRDERGAADAETLPRGPQAEDMGERATPAEAEGADQPRRQRGRPRRERPAEAPDAGNDRLQPPSFLSEAVVLPPAAPVAAEGTEESSPAPRRRTRRPRAEASEAVAEV